MRSIIVKLAFASATAVSAVGLSGCTADVHDNTMDVHDNTANIDDAKVEFETTQDTVAAGEMVHVTLKAEDVFLVDPSETPPPDSVKVAGHFEFFLDSTSGSSLLVTAEESVDVMIPPATPPGDHKLICRVDKHDGTPTEATFEMDLTIKASVTTGS
jgi:hypothetical protein